MNSYWKKLYSIFLFFNLISPLRGYSLLYQIVIVTDWSVLDVAIVQLYILFSKGREE